MQFRHQLIKFISELINSNSFFFELKIKKQTLQSYRQNQPTTPQYLTQKCHKN